MAPIIRGADTDNHALALQSAGLWAISAGLAFNIQDDQQLLAQGMIIYDALYSWANHRLPVRSGHDRASSFTLEFQFGIVF